MLAQARPMGMGSSSANSRWMVHVDVAHLGQGGPPAVELLGPQGLPAGGYQAEGGRGALFQHAGVGQQVKGGGGPVQDGDSPGVHLLHQHQGEREALLGQDHQGGAAAQGRVEVLHRGVKVKGGLVAENVFLRDLLCLGDPLTEVQNAVVAGHDPLGDAGRAGSEKNVGRVCVQHPGPPLGENLLLEGVGKARGIL